MIIRKTFQGAWELSEIVNGYLFTMQYFYYTKREATRRFKRNVKEKQNDNRGIID